MPAKQMQAAHAPSMVRLHLFCTDQAMRAAHYAIQGLSSGSWVDSSMEDVLLGPYPIML